MKKMMKRLNLGSLILASLFFVFTFSETRAQEPNNPQEIGVRPDGGGGPPRPNLLRELNLSPAQINQIQRLNRERKPIMQESQRRLHEANRALDEAIYADLNNETEIESRIKEVHSAHLEVIRNRTATELAIRRILTPEQLLRFRALRGQFMQKDNPENGPQPGPAGKMRNLPKGIRPRGFENRRP